MRNLVLEEMEKFGADGVDFVPAFMSPENKSFKVYESYTKEEMYKAVHGCFPRSGRLYWKMINGEKVYFDWEELKNYDV